MVSFLGLGLGVCKKRLRSDKRKEYRPVTTLGYVVHIYRYLLVKS